MGVKPIFPLLTTMPIMSVSILNNNLKVKQRSPLKTGNALREIAIFMMLLLKNKSTGTRSKVLSMSHHLSFLWDHGIKTKQNLRFVNY